MTRSTPSTPICNPQLPPPTDTNAGALQPLAVRHEAIPRPCLPPKMNPPLIRSGTTTMHLALLNTSSGMPLSGVAIAACNTSTDDCSRAIESSRPVPANAVVPSSPMQPINSSDIVFFIRFSFCTPLRGEDFRWADLVQRPERESSSARLYMHTLLLTIE